MRNTLLIGVAAAALLAGTALVSAQGQDRNPSGTERTAPAQTPGGAMGGNAQGADQQVQGAKDKADKSKKVDQGTKPDQKAQSPARSTTGQGQTQQGQGQMQQGQGQQGQERTGQGQRGNQDRMNQGQKGGTQDRMGQSPRDGTKDRAGQTERTTTSTSLTTEQRTKVRETVLKSSNAPRVSRSDIKFKISVGVVVPRSIQLVAVPAEVVTIYPAWRGYLFFLVGDEIIIVEPRTLRIVAVIEA